MENSEIIELLMRMKKDCNEKCGIFLKGNMNGPAFEMRGKAEAFETVVLMLENPEYFHNMKEKFLPQSLKGEQKMSKNENNELRFNQIIGAGLGDPVRLYNQLAQTYDYLQNHKDECYDESEKFAVNRLCAGIASTMNCITQAAEYFGLKPDMDMTGPLNWCWKLHGFKGSGD